jgi:cadmium resistance protein CadD (predicted permease)
LEIMPLVAVFVLVSSGFVATNLDNLLLLVLLQTSTERQLPVLSGFLAASAAVLALASIGLLLGEVLNPALVGYLGAVPLMLGCYGLWRRRLADASSVAAPVGRSGQSAAAAFSSSLLLMLSNSGDSLAIFLPLLADTSIHLFPVVFFVWFLLVFLWAWLAYRIAGNRSLAAMLERQGSRWLPWVMIGIGSYILLDTVTDSI